MIPEQHGHEVTDDLISPINNGGNINISSSSNTVGSTMATVRKHVSSCDNGYSSGALYNNNYNGLNHHQSTNNNVKDHKFYSTLPLPSLIQHQKPKPLLQSRQLKTRDSDNSILIPGELVGSETAPIVSFF